MTAVKKINRPGRRAPVETPYQTGHKHGLELGWKHGHWQGLCEAVIQSIPSPGERRPIHVMFVRTGKGYPYTPLDDGIAATLGEMVERVTVVGPYDDVVGLAAVERPDLVLSLDGMEFGTDQVQQIRSLGIRTSIWFTDDPYYTDVTSTIAPLYENVFTLERNCVPFYQNLGCARVHNVSLGVYPGAYRPRNPRREIRGDVCFIGSAYWNRVGVFHSALPLLEGRKFRISGLWWDRLPDFARWQDRIEVGRWMEPLETSEQYNAHSISVNIHRSHDDETFNQNMANITAASPNPRTFEISACGTLQIVDEREDIAQYYTPGREIVTFSSPEDLAAKVNYYLENEEERQAIALRALHRTMRDHTFASRLHQILDLSFAP